MALCLVLGLGASGASAAAPTMAAPLSPVAVVAAKAKPATVLKLTTSDKTPYVGQSITLKASVKKNGKAVKGATIVFERAHAMEGSWAAIGKAKAGPNGVASLNRKVAKWDGEYRIRYEGKTASREIFSRANLSWSLPAKKTLVRGQSLKFSVKSPSFGDSIVQLQRWDAKRKKWVGGTGMIHSFLPFNSRSNSECTPGSCIIVGPKGKASAKLWYFEQKGTHKYRLFQQGAQVHADSVTKAVTLTVK